MTSPLIPALLHSHANVPNSLSIKRRNTLSSSSSLSSTKYELISVMSSADTLYQSLQVVLVRPTASSGETITLHGEGERRPYNYRNALCKALNCTRFISTLFCTNQSKRYGIFVLSDFQTEKEKGDPALRNRIAHESFGMTLYGNIIFASAERCGDNQYLYDLGPICPEDVINLIKNGQVPSYLLLARKRKPPAGTPARQIYGDAKPLSIGVSVSINEAYREWWEAFSEAKQTVFQGLSEEALAKVQDHLYRFLNGMVSVWCGRCGSKYRRLSLCRGCQCVAYCARGCWKAGFTDHQDICHILSGKGCKEHEGLPEACVRGTEGNC